MVKKPRRFNRCLLRFETLESCFVLVPRRSDVHCLGPRAPQVLDGSPKERLGSYEVGRDASQCAEPQDLAQVRDEGNFFERPDVR